MVPHLLKDLPKGAVIKSVLERVVPKGQSGTVGGVLARFFGEKILAFLEEGAKIIHCLLEVVYALGFSALFSYDPITGPGCKEL